MLTCDAANNGGTPTSFEWFKDSVNLMSSDQKYEVTVEDKSFAGFYKCKVINADGSMESAGQRLRVNGELQSCHRDTINEKKPTKK